jgi:BMFP domain-containing protein YqiC
LDSQYDLCDASFRLAFAGFRHYLRVKRTGFAMTTGPNRILDEFAKLMTDAAGAAQGVRREVETAFKSQAEKVLNSMDVVQREEFEAVRDMALKARAENKKLEARIAELEAKLSGASGEGAAKASEATSKRAAKPSPKK